MDRGLRELGDELADEREADDRADDAAHPGDLLRTGTRRSTRFWHMTPMA